MFKHLQIIIVFAAVLAMVVPASAHDDDGGDSNFQLGAGLGIAYPSGMSYPGAPTVNELLALGVTGTYFTSSWVMIAADFSYGFLPGDLEFRFDSSGDYLKVDGWQWNLDLLVGVDKQMGEGGYLYLAAGLGVASSKNEYESYDSGDGTVEKIDIDTGTAAGLTIGAGAGLSISERVIGFGNLRYRFIKSEADIAGPGDPDVSTFAYGLGGTELMVGIAFWL